MESASILKVSGIAYDDIKLKRKLGHSFPPEPKYDNMLCMIEVKVAGVGSEDKACIHRWWFMKNTQGSFWEQSLSSLKH